MVLKRISSIADAIVVSIAESAVKMACGRYFFNAPLHAIFRSMVYVYEEVYLNMCGFYVYICGKA